MVNVGLSPRVLGATRTGLAGTRVRRRMYHDSIEALPFRGDIFSTIVDTRVLRRLPSPERKLGRVFQILRPNTPLVLIIAHSKVLNSLVR